MGNPLAGIWNIRLLARVVLALVASSLSLVAIAAPANAHPYLLFTTPALDSAVAESPASIVLVFNQGLTVEPDAITITTLRGEPVPVAESHAFKAGTVLSAELPEKLAPGTYRVHWAAVGVDGHAVEDEFRFAVGAPLTGAAASSDEPIADWFAALRKWLLLTGFTLAFGGLIAERFVAVARTENPTLPQVPQVSRYAAMLGLAAAATSAAVLVNDLGGVSALWESRPGLAVTAEAAGFALAIALLTSSRPRWALAPLAVVALAEGAVSHGGVESPVTGAALTAIHIGAAGLWAGALVHTARTVVAWRSRPHAVRWMLVSYARMALWVFLTVATSGLVLALILVPLPAWTASTYGQTLMVKLVLVLVAVGLAVMGRRVARQPAAELDLARRTTRFESATLVAVIAVTAVLVSMPTPAADAGAGAPPPPPRGMAVPGGGRAGQIGVNVVASEGQLVVRLFTPRRTDYIGPPEDHRYELSGRLALGEAIEDVRFRPCGGGCFVARLRWHDGDNVLTLRAQAQGWTGGTLAIAVPWPAVSPDDLIERTVRVMNAVEEMTIYESSTSDSSGGFPKPMVLDTDGPQLLSNEPFNTGVAPVAVAVRRQGEPTRLLLGFPAAGTFAELSLDGLGRISTETLVGPKIIFQRRFLYP